MENIWTVGYFGEQRGELYPDEIESTTEVVWDASLDTNLKAGFLCAGGCADAEGERGVIVNFADIGGVRPWPGYLPHCISKAGVIMMTKDCKGACAGGARKCNRSRNDNYGR